MTTRLTVTCMRLSSTTAVGSLARILPCFAITGNSAPSPSAGFLTADAAWSFCGSGEPPTARPLSMGVIPARSTRQEAQKPRSLTQADTMPGGIKRAAAFTTRTFPSAPTAVRSAAGMRPCPTAEPAIAALQAACIGSGKRRGDTPAESGRALVSNVNSPYETIPDQLQYTDLQA